MLGKTIVNMMGVILNIVCVLIILGGTIGGGIAAEGIGGALGGFVLGSLAAILTCGVAFFFLEINNNLVALNEKTAQLVAQKSSGSARSEHGETSVMSLQGAVLSFMSGPFGRVSP